MTNSELQEGIYRCFGRGTRGFCEHPADLREAYDFLGELISFGVGWKELQPIIEKVASRLTGPKVDDQISKAKTYFAPWILD